MRRERMNRDTDLCLRNTYTAMIDQHQRNEKSCTADASPTVPRRLSEEAMKLRPPLSVSSSSSSLSFMVASTPSVSSCLTPRLSSKKGIDGEKSRIQRSKSSSILEVVVPLPEEGSSLKRRQSFGGRRGSLTLSNRTNSLKRSGTSSSLRRSSSISTTASISSLLDEEERNCLVEDGLLDGHDDDVAVPCHTLSLAASTSNISLSEDEEKYEEDEEEI